MYCFFRVSNKIIIESKCIGFFQGFAYQNRLRMYCCFLQSVIQKQLSPNIFLFLQGFIQNQNRVSTLKDKSILPDLCSSHKKQLLVMVSNHKKIQETKKKCKMAKEELAINLHARLRYDFLL